MTQIAIEVSQNQLTYHRPSRARTLLDLADLAEVEVFAVEQQCYWHLIQANRSEAVVPMGIPGEARIRQYLAQWRGFDYDGLVRFISEPPAQGRRRLWPALNQTRPRANKSGDRDLDTPRT